MGSRIWHPPFLFELNYGKFSKIKVNLLDLINPVQAPTDAVNQDYGHMCTATCHLTLPLMPHPLNHSKSPPHTKATYQQPCMYPQGYFVAFSPFGDRGERN